MERGLATLSGWGRVLRSSSVTLAPLNTEELAGIFAEPRPRAHGLIAHGASRSYGDASLNAEGSALLTRGLDRVLSFDPGTGDLEVEPGVTFRQLLAAFLPRNFLVPVTPGTGFATIGGAVAHDVHGKNHEHAGSFGQHVTELDLLTPDGTLRTIGPARDAALFAATVGGLGLTGIVTRVAFRMARVPGRGVRVALRRCADLDMFLAAMDGAAGATYAVGWIDGTARGRALGRGVLETAEPSDADMPVRRGRRLRVPFDLPNFVLNPFSIRLFNAAYWRRVPSRGVVRWVPFEKFLYPLDALHDWNRIYGRRGFHQFQNVLPFEAGPRALRELLEVISSSGRASFLAVLKRLGAGIMPPGQAGLLSFPQPGYTLALDFPAGPGIEALYARLVAITRDYGGRVYLAKDALITADDFRAMYPRWDEFRTVLDDVDPGRRLQSDLSRRLRIRDAA